MSGVRKSGHIFDDNALLSGTLCYLSPSPTSKNLKLLHFWVELLLYYQFFHKLILQVGKKLEGIIIYASKYQQLTLQSPELHQLILTHSEISYKVCLLLTESFHTTSD